MSLAVVFYSNLLMPRLMKKILDEGRPPFPKEFINYVLPILEVAFQWHELKEDENISDTFIENCRKRMISSGSNFRGVMFEIDTATRSSIGLGS